jgi:hypothetical protein
LQHSHYDNAGVLGLVVRLDMDGDERIRELGLDGMLQPIANLMRGRDAARSLPSGRLV